MLENHGRFYTCSKAEGFTHIVALTIVERFVATKVRRSFQENQRYPKQACYCCLLK
jgi:hypothetical protein